MKQVESIEEVINKYVARETFFKEFFRISEKTYELNTNDFKSINYLRELFYPNGANGIYF